MVQIEIIKTTNLTKSYNGVLALKNLNLTVNKHSIFGFLGPNGAGKSTTIKLLMGLIQPTAGSGKIFGYDIKDESMKIRARIGYLQQEPSFYDHLTAREVLEFTARFFFSAPKKGLNKRVSEVLELVSLLDKSDRPIKGYSTGEKRRLGIAQATINYPDLLILDEPAASLDPIGRQDVLKIMSKLRDYTTIFYSTHILEFQRNSSLVIGVPIALYVFQQILFNFTNSFVDIVPWGLTNPLSDGTPSIVISLILGIQPFSLLPIIITSFYVIFFLILTMKNIQKQDI